MVAGEVKNRINSGVSLIDCQFDGLFYAIAKLLAFIYSEAAAMCSFSYFSNTSQYTLSVIEISV